VTLIYEFHVSRRARDQYQFDDTLFATNGNVIFANFHASRLFSQKINEKRDLVSFPEQAVRAGQLNALGLIDEILHLVVILYRQERNPIVMEQALEYLYEKLGREKVQNAIRLFIGEFPPVAVYRRDINEDEYLEGESEQLRGPGPSPVSVPNLQVALEEMLLLWLANANPATSPFLELFDDSGLERESVYPEIINHLQDFFDLQPVYGPDAQSLVDMLRSPAKAVPHSLVGQLEYIRERWFSILGKYIYRLLSTLDLVKEEEKAIFLGPGPAHVYEFTGMELEPERFTPDKDWMPNITLIAKNAFVWLDQLSKKYRKDLYRLDQIPDEELDRLSSWGISGLWLIGLWERSDASKRIKQLRGNPEAVASAYSLFDYQIAKDLGGDEAYQNLRDRAWKRGVRLASDMVPNHMGIDSRWVVEHPDWFISLEYSPFPSYSFNGPNLSWDDRVGIFLEDHYYDNTDAAVVFKRVDNHSGETRYIYHGNDGTSMPWNDTAQLNYLKPEVREAVIQTILHVARQFPVIRFDAAMTLAKKHYQRLWFPEPGTGGAIPTRADHGLTKDQFDALFPEEFWREVVDRIAEEQPDTLLLAEAFWLMEGYFVRTLGMHRVYNSAFMNMLRDEKNAEYRLVIKNTLEFDNEILKRYVNFMNNPDERTAVDQFGKGDKYFGVCVLMITMPGLPMFGHGQVEGFTEKYGMEYRKAYWDESPDSFLIERHEREIFPLLRLRRLFTDVTNFLLYDFYTQEGFVNEDVYAFSNRNTNNEASLVIYHNKFASTQGWIRTSAAFSVKTGQGEKVLIQKTIGEGLGLENQEDKFCIFRDRISSLEYIRSTQEIYDKGLYFELDAYKFHVYTDFQQIEDNEWRQYAQLESYLDGTGVPSIQEALQEIFLQPIHHPFRELVNTGFFQWIIDNRVEKEIESAPKVNLVLDEAEQKMLNLLREIKRLTQGSGNEIILARTNRYKLESILKFPSLATFVSGLDGKKQAQTLQYLNQKLVGKSPFWGPLLGFLFTHELGLVETEIGPEEVSRSWVDEWLLGKILANTFSEIGLDENESWRKVSLVKILIGHQNWHKTFEQKKDRTFLILQSWLRDGEIQHYLGINRHQGVLWFNKESFEDLLWWMFIVAAVDIVSGELRRQNSKDGDDPDQGAASDKESKKEEQAAEKLTACYETIKKLQAAMDKSDYQVDRLLEAAKD
jgi:glycosidase